MASSEQKSDSQSKVKTKFKQSPSCPHTKLYPTLENPLDHYECTDADHSLYRFDYTELDKATDYLLQNGYVVIKQVMDKSDIEKGKALLWKKLSSDEIGWDKDKYSTWDIYKIGGELQNGLIWGKGIGQSEFQWFGRTHPKVLNTFAHLWSHDAFPGDINIANNNADEQKRQALNGATDLLTSFDGISIFTPWYLTSEMDRTASGWFHIDQNIISKKGIHTIQGYVTYFDQNESTGSTCLIPKSHLAVSQDNPLKIRAMSGDFIRVRKGSKFLDSALYKKILVCCKAGDMVLWDSRTIHCNSPALLSLDEMRAVHSSKKKHVELLRLVGMVCMAPKYRMKNANKKEVLKKRVDAYVNKCTSSHWPTEFSPLSMEYKWNKDIPRNDMEKASDVIKSLVGYT